MLSITIVTTINDDKTCEQLWTVSPKSSLRSRAVNYVLSVNPEASISDTTNPATQPIGTFALEWDGLSVKIFELVEVDSVGWFYTTKVSAPVLRCTIVAQCQTDDVPNEDVANTDIATDIATDAATDVATDAATDAAVAPSNNVSSDETVTEQLTFQPYPRRQKLKVEIKTEVLDELKHEGLLKPSITDSTICRISDIIRQEYEQVIKDLQSGLEPRQPVTLPQAAPVITHDSFIDSVRNFDRSSLRHVRALIE